MLNDFNELGKSYENNYNQYFDLDLVKPNKNAIYVDIGAYTGDTIVNYINTFLQYKKIYAYEITDESIKIMQKNLKNYPNIIYKKTAIMDRTSIFYMNDNSISSSANKVSNIGIKQILSTSLDKDIKEKIDIIKIDIEGNEEKALNGAINHIKKDTPILDIAVYHNHNDLWKIPKLIYSINDKYKYFLRYFGNKYYPTEVILIAIKKDN